MDAKTPTQRMFEELVEEVMLYLHEANCFGETGMNDERYQEVFDFYTAEVRAAIGTVVNPTIDVVAVYTVGDVTDRLHILTDWGEEEGDYDWPLERRLKLLNSVVHSSEMAQMFEHLLDEAILSGFQ